MSPSENASSRAALRIVRGEPDAIELAALVAIVSATGDDEPPAPRPRGRWNDPASLTRPSGRPGPGGWRAAVR